MMMGLMMGKMMAALGFGGVSLLAMKALAVSMMALMLAGILGLKKLTEHGKGRNNDDGSSVESLFDNYPRRRRGVERVVQGPYRGWTKGTAMRMN